MDRLEMYTVGTKAWFKHPTEGYIVATLTSKDQQGDALQLRFAPEHGGDPIEFTASIADLLQVKFEGLPLLKNPPHLEGSDDLTALSYLHEAAVLNSVKIRYKQHNIYTYSGLVLIAMNPFAHVNIYSKDLMRTYAGRPKQELEPHLFAIAEGAYRAMITQGQNQSIIVSGESGAGKTQSAKYVMRYFALVDQLSVGSRRSSGHGADEPSKIEDAVLSTNPIMEAFGNAKTTRNDNSSRFGKYIEILFDPKTDGPGVEITGAKMRTYLLERSRLVFQPKSERNYHIFYQLCAAAPAAEREQLGLDSWDHFHYLKQGETGIVNGMDDAAEFAATQKALSIVGVSVSLQWDVFRVCAALLHLGNIEISENRGIAEISNSDPALVKTSSLLGLEPMVFKQWIVKRQIITRSEKIIKDSSASEALIVRDSVAKFIYSMLFDWLVKIVNQKLDQQKTNPNRHFIGVLDIYGFEHFERNSFEQFCINYANEKLQQEFTRHVFKLEQEEYVLEEITWSFIDFSDNGPCIELIENKLGILDFLDEETRLPSGSDNNLVTKLYNRFASPPNTSAFFGKPRFGNSEFIIKHYALDVTYQIEGFIEKNKDTVSEEILETLQTTSFDFMKTFITVADVEQSPGPNRSGRSKKPTLGSIFKNSLIQLMDTLRATNPHYIRCIKPNQAKVAFEFEPQNVLGQLVACGVLETIKISRAGYPSKQLFQDFVDRYYFLVSSSQWKTAPKKLCHTIASSCIKGENKFELGKSKIFFRAGQLAYLEKKRSVKFTAIITLIQKNARRNFHQKKYVAMRQGAVKIQAVWRGKSARIRYHAAQKERAVVRIQKNMRMCIARKSYKKILSAAICIQCAWRRHVRRRDFEFYAREKAALDIQRVWRGHKSRKSTSKILGRIILIQSCIRRRRARLQFKLLRVEARSVGNLQQVNYKLESKILQLSQKINQTKEDRTELAEKAATLESQLHTWKDKFARLEAEFKEKSVSTEQECVDLKKQIIRLLEAKEIMSKEAEKANNMVKKRDDQLAALTAENESLKKSSKATESKKNSSKEESATLISLRREVVSLREQMSRLVTGKYSTDKATENFLGNSYTPVPSTAKSMSFLESAALVTAQVAESWMGGARAPDAAATTIQTIPLDEQEKEFAEPMGRATRMLQANDLQEEVTECLIRKLRIPLPNTKSVSTRKEILFPAHLIGYLLNQMVQHEMVSRLVSTADIVLRSIRQLTIEFQDDYLSAFWTSNVIELAAILGTIRERVPLPAAANQDDQLSPNAALAKIREECEILLTEMYHGWVKEIKKRLVAMIVPAVIDSQSLPGYICEKPASIWGKVGFSRPVPAFSIDQLLKFITKLSNTMKCYYLQDALCRQLLTELVRYIGVSAFNHLLTRKNFLTWKRGVQIQFNVSRIEEWCLGNGITEATLHLQQLLQAGKLLTLNKTTQSDMETIYDVCFLLNHSQINKILMLYYASDFDSPLSTELLKIVNERALLVEKGEQLMLDLDSSPEFIKPERRRVTIEQFIPVWVSLPYIQAVVSAALTTSPRKNSSS